ncbi:hypothetical protein BZG36_05086, partial [Bifiguratus adelaidae]
MPNLTSGANTGFYRMSLLDITYPSFYAQVAHPVNSSLGVQPSFNITFDHYGYESLSTDQLSKLHTWSTVPELTFDLTINGTATALLDGGVGTFYFGSGPM